MSGKPNIEGIRLLRSAVERFTSADNRIGVLSSQINEANKELGNQLSERTAAREIIFNAMDKMDVSSSGNWGWQERMLVFLSEFQRQDTISVSFVPGGLINSSDPQAVGR